MGWFGTIIGALFILLLWASLASGEWDILLALLSPIILIINLLFLFLLVWALVRIFSWVRKRVFFRPRSGKDDAGRREGRARLAEAFEPVVVHQQAVNRRLLEWVRDQIRSTDKPEYRKMLEGILEDFTEKDGFCNFRVSIFSGYRKDRLPYIDLETLPESGGGLRLQPGEFVDRSDWERRIRFILYGRWDGIRTSGYGCRSALDLGGARRIVECALTHHLRKNALAHVVGELALDRTTGRRLIERYPCPDTEIFQYEPRPENE